MLEELVYESPKGGWRVEYEEVELSYDRSIRSAWWVSEGFYAHREDAESEARDLERQGNRVRIVKVVA